MQPVFSQSVAYGKRWTRAACGVALAIAAALAVQGCTSAPASGGTGGGQAAPAVTAAEASQAWESYRAAVAQAASAGDEASYLASLTGAAYVTHSTALKVAGASRLRLLAGGNYRYGTPTFYLPEPAGYPRWFVADVNTTQAGPSQLALTPAEGAPVPWAAPGHGRLLYLFEKASATAPWQLASESALAPGVALPALAADGSGHVPAQVPDTALLAPAGVAGPLQAAVVDDGPASSAAKVVASGPLTTGLYATMRSTLLGLSVPAGDVSQWELEGSNYQRFALRTADGGALVLYAMYLNTAVEVPAVLNKAQPVNPGPPITVPAYVMPLLPPGEGTPRKTLATQQLLSFAAVDPPAGNGKIQVIAIGGGLSYASASLPAALASEPGATSVLITRVATDSVVNVNRSLSQISPSVPAARSTAEAFRDSQAATRSPATPCPPTASTSLVSAACAPYSSSRRDDRAMDAQRSSRGSATIRSRSLPSCSRSATAK